MPCKYATKFSVGTKGWSQWDGCGSCLDRKIQGHDWLWSNGIQVCCPCPRGHPSYPYSELGDQHHPFTYLLSGQAHLGELWDLRYKWWDGYFGEHEGTGHLRAIGCEAANIWERALLLLLIDDVASGYKNKRVMIRDSKVESLMLARNEGWAKWPQHTEPTESSPSLSQTARNTWMSLSGRDQVEGQLQSQLSLQKAMKCNSSLL